MVLFSIALWGIVFAISIFILVKSADIFIENAEKIGKIFGVPQFIIGVTLVAFGTSLPELATSISAVFQNVAQVVPGNVVGSNIANILLIVGVSAIIAKKLNVEWDLASIDLPILSGATILLYLSSLDGVFTFGEAILFFIGLLFYLKYALGSRIASKEEKSGEKISIKIILFIIGSITFIWLSSHSLIVSLKELGAVLNLDTGIIALTAVAIGTSLPELTASISAARRGNYEVALGNVLGSNIFNSLFVLAFPALFMVIPFSPETLTIGMPFMLGATFLYIISTLDRKVTEHEGWFFILMYILFIAKIFNFF